MQQTAFQFQNTNRHRYAPNCPCGKSNRDGKFSPLKNSDPQYGKCHSCGKLFLPKQDRPEETWRAPVQHEPVAYIPERIFQSTLQKFEDNNFHLWLVALFGLEKAKAAQQNFLYGTAKGGKTIYWQVDTRLRVRTGKIQLHSPYTGKRDKKVNNWAHSMLSLPGRFVQCLYGVHQLNTASPSAPVVLCESSKNAIIGWLHYPDLVWLGTDGATGLTNQKAEPLQGRTCILLPDADQTGRERFTAHCGNILELYKCKIEVCDMFPELADGTDIADYLSEEARKKSPTMLLNADGYPAFWDM